MNKCIREQWTVNHLSRKHPHKHKHVRVVRMLHVSPSVSLGLGCGLFSWPVLAQEEASRWKPQEKSLEQWWKMITYYILVGGFNHFLFFIQFGCKKTANTKKNRTTTSWNVKLDDLTCPFNFHEQMVSLEALRSESINHAQKTTKYQAPSVVGILGALHLEKNCLPKTPFRTWWCQSLTLEKAFNHVDYFPSIVKDNKQIQKHVCGVETLSPREKSVSKPWPSHSCGLGSKTKSKALGEKLTLQAQNKSSGFWNQ